MAIDGLLLILAPLPAVGSGDTAVFDAPSGTFTTVAGSVDTITAAPVSLTTDADWFPFDPDASRTMQVGYNKTSDEYYNGSRIYADRFKASSGWINYTGTTTLDSNGELTGISGNAYIYLWATPYAGDDLVRGRPCRNRGPSCSGSIIPVVRPTPDAISQTTAISAIPSGRGSGLAYRTTMASTRSNSPTPGHPSCRSARHRPLTCRT